MILFTHSLILSKLLWVEFLFLLDVFVLPYIFGSVHLHTVSQFIVDCINYKISLFSCVQSSLWNVWLVRHISISHVTCLHFVAVDSGVSSFNQFVHELSVDSASSSGDDNSSGEEDYEDSIFPASPMSQSSRLSRASSFTKYERRRIHWLKGLLLWILWPLIFIVGLPFRIYHSSGFQRSETVPISSDTHQSSKHPIKRSNTIKDHIVHRTTDRRRGVVEVIIWQFFLKCYPVIISSLLTISIHMYIIVFATF